MGLTTDNRPLMEMVSDSIRCNWNKIAFSDYGTNNSFTYGELYRNVLFIQQLFAENNLKEGDKVVIWDKNSANWATIYLATLSYGCVAVPLLADFSLDQANDLVRHSEAKMVFSSQCSILGGLKTINTKTILDNPCLKDYWGLLSDEELREEVSLSDGKPDDLAVISYTSGSTGNPKGVMITCKSLWSNVWYARKVYQGLTAQDHFISMLPLAHMFGQTFEFLFPLSAGCEIHFITRIPSPKVMLKAFSDIKPFIVITVPLIVEKIIRNKIFPILRKPLIQNLTKIPGVKSIIYKAINRKLTSVFGRKFREVVFGGAAISPEIEVFLRIIHFPYTTGYGMTECGPLIAFDHWNTNKAGACGKPCDRMEVKILSDDPENKEGEIVCKGMNVMIGYYKNPEATREAIDSEGWLHTGDLGTMSKDGYIFIRGRKKNMLLGSNGQNIYPEEVENKIVSITGADECVLVQREDRLVGLIYVSDSALQVLQTTREHFNERLNEMKRTINEALPKFSQIYALESQTQEFQKTPKRNIKRYLYK